MTKMKHLIRLMGILTFLLVFTHCKNTQLTGNESEYDYLKKAYKHVVLKDYKGAIQIYTRVLDINPENVEAYVYRGMCKYHINDFQGSLIDYDKAIEIQPNYAEAYNLRGVSKGELGDKQGACDDWQKAFEYGFKNSFELIKEFCWED